MTPTAGPVDPTTPSPDALLAALDAEQRTVARTLLGPVAALAGAGTGKTRAITHRIAYGVHSGVYQPQRVLAVTFTARAAGEMRVRLRELGVVGVQARTFHAAALRQLHYFWPHAIGGAAPEILPHKAPVVGEAASRLRLRLDRTELRDVAAEVEWAKVSLLTPESYAELDGHVERYRGNRALLLDGLRGLGFDRLAPADGAFYVYADIGDRTRDSMAWCLQLLHETGVAEHPRKLGLVQVVRRLGELIANRCGTHTRFQVQ